MNPKQLTRKSINITLPIVISLALLVILLSQIQFVEAQQTYPGYTIFPQSPSRNLIPANATYTRDNRIQSFRPTYQEWECPVYRVAAGTSVPLVTITNTYSGRVETWPIPTSAIPASEADGHMCVINLASNTVYEFFEAVWTGTRTMRAGGMVAFPMGTTGISDPPSRRVTASGFANMFGMIKREDFINPATGQLDPNNTVLRHALTIAFPSSLIGPNTYVAPAVGGEVSGSNSSTGLPMGALLALPRNLNVDTLNVSPIVRIILRAARDYGLYVSDVASTANYNGSYAGAIEVEPGLLATLYGGSSNNDHLSAIQAEIYSVVSQYGLYRVTGASTSAPTATSIGATSTPRPTDIGGGQSGTPTVTNTPVPPTSTLRPTNTVVPPTSTPRPTNTPVPATVTPRPTDIGGGQSGTPTATNTPVPPPSTPRPTNTVVPPPSTPRPTNTPVPTVVPPTATPVPTGTPNPTTLGTRIVIPATTIRVGNTFTVSIMLDNPALAAGGGVDAAEVECVLTPEYNIVGRNVTAGNAFGPNPVIVSRNFPWSDYMMFAISQSGSNPPVTISGSIVNMTIRADRRGQATITCTVSIITANGTEMPLNPAPVTFRVRR